MAFISSSLARALFPLLDTVRSHSHVPPLGCIFTATAAAPPPSFPPPPPLSVSPALSLLRGLYARSFSDRRRLRPLTPFRRTHFVASALTKMDESISERHSFRRSGSECALRFMVERMRGPWLALDWNRFSGLGVNPCLISHTYFFCARGTSQALLLPA